MNRIDPVLLDKAMKRRGTKNTVIAERCKVSPSTVLRWRKGEIPVKTKYNRIICYTLDMRINTLRRKA